MVNITDDKLGLKSEKIMQILNVKCDTILIGSFRREEGFYPAYHMNKSSWLTIDIRTVKSDEIKMLLDMSYELTNKNLYSLI